jgi:hypothetical protein
VTEWRVDVNDADARRRLERLGLMLTDLRSFWPMVTRLWIGWMGQMFESEGAFAGRPWAPLSPRYAAWKAARFPGKKILTRTGQLRRAATSPTRRATPTVLTLTIESEVAVYHQEGTPRMPARPPVFSRLPAAAQEELDRAADQYVRDLLGRL